MLTPSTKPQLILVAGPYRSNTDDDPIMIAQNMRCMNETALALFRLGHVPITGEAIALPLIELAGSRRPGDELFNEIFHPVARRLINHVDAVLRVGGPSKGADEMVAISHALGKQVYTTIAEVKFVA